MSTSAAVRQGYKQTEVGVIPDDWEVATLGEISATSSGTTPARALADRYFRNGTINWVKTLDLNDTEVSETDERVTLAALEETCLRAYPVGTVLVAMYGGFNQIGRTGLLRIPAAVNQAITAIQPRATKLCPEYLLADLNFKVDYWKTVASSSRKDPNITSQDVRAFPVALPQLLEQRAIAAALSDVDALLAKLDAFIAKKRDLKQAAMQQLLTGQTRLPGFSGEWKERCLFEICQMKSGEGITSDEIGSHSKFPCYGGNGLRGFATRYTHEGNYALIGRQGALCGNVLSVAGKFFASEHAIVVTPAKGTEIRWLAMVLDRMKLNQYSESSAQPGLSVSRLLSFSSQLPPLEEQTAIATVLTDMDTELAALGARRDKTRALKQGMMQELLTGRIRLV